MNNLQLTADDEKKINAAEAFLNGAKAFIIDNDDSFQLANDMLKKIKMKKNELDAMRKFQKKPINEAAKNIENLFRQPINFLTQAEQAYKAKILKYSLSVADRKTESGLSSMQLTAAALEALKNNDYEKYAELSMEISKLDNKAPKADGVSYRDNWKGKVLDLSMVIQGIAEGKIPASIIKVDDSALNQLAKSIKNTVTYPGIEFYNEQVVTVKTG